MFATGAGRCQVRELGKAEESLRLQRWEQELLPSAPQTGVRAVSLGLDNFGGASRLKAGLKYLWVAQSSRSALVWGEIW